MNYSDLAMKAFATLLFWGGAAIVFDVSSVALLGGLLMVFGSHLYLKDFS
jgi:hypothetical protein